MDQLCAFYFPHAPSPKEMADSILKFFMECPDITKRYQRFQLTDAEPCKSWFKAEYKIKLMGDKCRSH